MVGEVVCDLSKLLFCGEILCDALDELGHQEEAVSIARVELGQVILNNQCCGAQNSFLNADPDPAFTLM